jgi:hypothetical protein
MAPTPPRAHVSPPPRPAAIPPVPVAPVARVLIAAVVGFSGLPTDGVPTNQEPLRNGGHAPWWDVLGVKPAATHAEVITAYRMLVKVHHPDAGGDPAQFRRLRAAYDDALATIR